MLGCRSRALVAARRRTVMPLAGHSGRRRLATSDMLRFAGGAPALCRPSAIAEQRRCRMTGIVGGEQKPPLQLTDLRVGQFVEGEVVQIYCPTGVAVDINCPATLAFLEVEEFGDGFPFAGPFSAFKIGHRIRARILDVSPDSRMSLGVQDPHGDHGESGRLHLTMRSGGLPRPVRQVADATRSPADLEDFEHLHPRTWLAGEVVMFSSWAAYVKVFPVPGGEPHLGILTTEDFGERFADEAIRGLRVHVRIKTLDRKSRRLELTMRAS